MSEAYQKLNEAMLLLAKEPGAVFVGQGVAHDGGAMYSSLNGVPMQQRIELPVMEEMQLGICAGLSLQGFLPISIYPRFDFLLRAVDQLVNHLDKLDEMSCGQFRPKVIIRTRVGPKHPLCAGPQHTQDHTEAFCWMLQHIAVARIESAEEVVPAYERALERPGSTLIVENLG